MDGLKKQVCSLLVIMMLLAVGAGDKGLAAASDSHAADPMTLSLPEAIAIALRSNRDVKRTQIDRVLNKFSLDVAASQFGPNLNLSASPSAAGGKTKTEGVDDEAISSTFRHTSGLAADKLFEYGGKLDFSWSRSDNLGNTNTGPETYGGSNTWKAGFSQPLLKGFGKAVTTYSLVQARLNEASNLLALRDGISSVVNSTISAFRNYAQAARQVEISRASVERSKTTLETNQLLISMGRMPANELIQTESDLANQELSYEETLNRLDNARLALLKVLNLDQDTRIQVIEETDFSPIHPDLDNCLAIAFNNRKDYLDARNAVEIAEIGLIVAENNMKWQLDFTGDYTITDSNNRAAANTDSGAWSAGLTLSAPLYGTRKLTDEQGLLSAKAGLTKARLSLEDTKQDITLGLKDAIRQVETSLKQLGMSVRARELSEQKLAVEKEKLAVGRSTNFQLVSFQNDLNQSLTSELDAKIAYLNALSALDTFLATTTDTWKIDYNKDIDQWPGN